MAQQPRTRVEEIMRARGLKQSEIALRGGWHTSNLSRIMSGRVGLSAVNRRQLALILNCLETALIQPIGDPIPPPMSDPEPPVTLSEAFEDRIGAIGDMLGVTDLKQFVPFVLGGEFSALPERTAERLREALQARQAARREKRPGKRRR